MSFSTYSPLYLGRFSAGKPYEVGDELAPGGPVGIGRTIRTHVNDLHIQYDHNENQIKQQKEELWQPSPLMRLRQPMFQMPCESREFRLPTARELDEATIEEEQFTLVQKVIESTLDQDEVWPGEEIQKSELQHEEISPRQQVPQDQFSSLYQQSTIMQDPYSTMPKPAAFQQEKISPIKNLRRPNFQQQPFTSLQHLELSSLQQEQALAAPTLQHSTFESEEFMALHRLLQPMIREEQISSMLKHREEQYMPLKELQESVLDQESSPVQQRHEKQFSLTHQPRQPTRDQEKYSPIQQLRQPGTQQQEFAPLQPLRQLQQSLPVEKLRHPKSQEEQTPPLKLLRRPSPQPQQQKPQQPTPAPQSTPAPQPAQAPQPTPASQTALSSQETLTSKIGPPPKPLVQKTLTSKIIPGPPPKPIIQQKTLTSKIIPGPPPKPLIQQKTLTSKIIPGPPPKPLIQQKTLTSKIIPGPPPKPLIQQKTLTSKIIPGPPPKPLIQQKTLTSKIIPGPPPKPAVQKNLPSKTISGSPSKTTLHETLTSKIIPAQQPTPPQINPALQPTQALNQSPAVLPSPASKATPAVATPPPQSRNDSKENEIHTDNSVPAKKSSDKSSYENLINNVLGVKCKKKLTNKEWRRRQNVHLRRIISPKNALIVLNEMLPGDISQIKVEPALPPPYYTAADAHSFCAELTVDGVNYKGYGNSKMEARNEAAEQVFRDLILKHMGKLQRRQDANPEHGSGPDDWEDEESDGGEEALPMIQLASFALHKLFAEWEGDGHKVPHLKALPPPALQVGEECSGGAGGAGGTGGTGGGGGGGVQVPKNAGLMQPCMLLSHLRPELLYREVPAAPDGAAPAYTMALDIDGRTYVGTAVSKREARKAAAREACTKHFGVVFSDG